MHLSNIKLWNFRKYGDVSSVFDLAKPNLDLNFTQGINVLIGENDSGKTAIIDAIKLVLRTHSFDYIKVEDKDFFNDSKRLRIELIFEDLSDQEAKNFTEWLSWKGNGTDAEPFLKLNCDITRNDKKINPFDIKAGPDADGYLLTAEAKEYLKITYLKPLRDAENELISKRNSRLSQILLGDTAFKEKNQNHELVQMFAGLNQNLKKYFKGEEISFIDKDGNNNTEVYEDGKIIKDKIDCYIKAFYDDNVLTEFNVSTTDLKSILEKFSLFLESQSNVGLGTLNRLFMAAELLHLNKESWHGLRLGLVEELEAHLHPQAQMQVIQALQKQKQIQIQLILTTHSPNLASKVKLENLILCSKNYAYPLGKAYTLLDEENYIFLEKFLDTTKSNLFFAKGIIFVEGWAEEILIPSFAKAIGIDLTAKGISIVNIGGVGFQHYANIFLRRDFPHLNIPVVIITDSDIRAYKRDNFEKIHKKKFNRKTSLKLIRIKNKSKQKIKYYPAPYWTLEYCLYQSQKLSEIFKEHTKIIHSKTPWNSNFELELAKKLIKKNLDKTGIAYRIAHELDQEIEKESHLQTLKLHETESNDTIYYLLEAIRYVTNN